MRGTNFFGSLFVVFILLSLLFGTSPNLAFFPLVVLMLGLILEPPKDVTVEREIEKTRTRVGERINVTLKVKVRKGIGIVLVRDNPPASFKVEGKTSTTTFVHPFKRKFEISYTLVPLKRGEFELPKVEVFCIHFLKFYPMSYFLTGEPIKIAVVPSPGIGRVVRAKKVLTKKSPVMLYSLTGALTTDFKEIREYVYGDAFKFINWKATARTGKLLVNEFEREGKRSIMIFLDSRMENLGSHVDNPLEYAVDLAYALATFYLSKGNNVGLYVIGQEKLVTPSSSSAHRETILKALLGAEYKVEETINEAFSKASQVLMRYAPTIILITNVTEEIIEELKKIKGNVVLVDISLYKKIMPNEGILVNLKKKSLHSELKFPAILWDVSKHDIRQAFLKVVMTA
ncbi:DUF58 domain-containing protein [Pyrococcus furiosus DSM 3638]|uniref:DUF58 domain-containing protein n=3 Tax=Pyrococcus furiosus TaxID=2261 RepID=A0A5C0XNA0_PYRFU|nr:MULTISPECIES: DUF58 domain-containing protein [Pyrococcus]AAL80541.1 hypothetical protein PF0417 [Pyrococcus furiosus DSM 3638]AFN03207.1 hypothetical protein PFC_01170 [Pyrococcus furiosus COM1]MDK2869252.1 hypothetical protein [Pyrococcus sp.]QEK78132.1 DUF58 domain-containing protein [Pyrococcus furiosus DSM 3638]